MCFKAIKIEYTEKCSFRIIIKMNDSNAKQYQTVKYAKVLITAFQVKLAISSNKFNLNNNNHFFLSSNSLFLFFFFNRKKKKFYDNDYVELRFCEFKIVSMSSCNLKCFLSLNESFKLEHFFLFIELIKMIIELNEINGRSINVYWHCLFELKLNACQWHADADKKKIKFYF